MPPGVVGVFYIKVLGNWVIVSHFGRGVLLSINRGAQWQVHTAGEGSTQCTVQWVRVSFYFLLPCGPLMQGTCGQGCPWRLSHMNSREML